MCRRQHTQVRDIQVNALQILQRFVGRLQICQVQPFQTLTNPVDLCVRMRKI